MTPLGVPTYASNIEHRFGIPCPLLDNMTVEEARERAAEARHGGRIITSLLGRIFREASHYWVDFPAALRGEGLRVREGSDMSPGFTKGVPGGESPAAALRHVWRTHLTPGDAFVGSGRGETARAAREAARSGGPYNASYTRTPSLSLRDAESMAEWPIYAAARQEVRA